MLKARKVNDNFNLVEEVDISGSDTIHKKTFTGDVYIQTDGMEKNWTGEHSVSDFEEDFGFEVVEAVFEFTAIDKNFNQVTFHGENHHEAEVYAKKQGLVITQSARL